MEIWPRSVRVEFDMNRKVSCRNVMSNAEANPDASQFFLSGASAFPAPRAGKGDFVAVSPDEVGPQGAFITPRSVMDAG